MVKHYDLLVVGGGSGGIATAERASAFGANVAIIERNRLGGTCVNEGCVPKKIMWYAGQLADAYHFGEDYGFQCQGLNFNFKKLVTHREQYIAKLNKIYEDRLQKNKITY